MCYFNDKINEMSVSREMELMENVTNQIHYHLQAKCNRKQQWNVGDKIRIGDSLNPFFSYYNDHGRSVTVAGSVYNTNDISREWLNKHITGQNAFGNDFNIDAATMIKSLHVALEHYLRYTREMIFEEIRKEINPDLPSRQKGLWLLNNDNINESIRFWKIQLDQDVRIIKLQVNGKIHRGHSHPLLISTDAMDIIRNRARIYWSNVQDHKIDDEFLFIGDIEVLEISE